jgi:hypothetical protein
VATRAGSGVCDSLAIGAGTLCLVHCLVLPLVVLLLPTLATVLTVPESFHLLALAFAVPTSAFALGTGIRQHGLVQPLLLAAPGLALMAFGALAAPDAEWERALTVIGTLLLVGGHLINWRGLRRAHGPALA